MDSFWDFEKFSDKIAQLFVFVNKRSVLQVLGPNIKLILQYINQNYIISIIDIRYVISFKTYLIQNLKYT